MGHGVKTAMLDFGVAPDLDLAEIGAELEHHYLGLGVVRVQLGLDDMLRLNGRPVMAFVHHWQSRGAELSVLDLAPELRNLQLLNGVLCGFLWRNPSFIPWHWNGQLDIDGTQNTQAGGGVIFWGTTVKWISGLRGFPVLQTYQGRPLVSVIGEERLISMKASATLI